MVCLEDNRDHSVIFEIAPKYCILDSSIDYKGYSISSKGFLPTGVDIMVIWIKLNSMKRQCEVHSFKYNEVRGILLTMPKPLTVWITIKWKILKEMGIPDHLTCLLRYLYAGQEATVRTRHGTTDWLQIAKGVRQGCIMLRSPAEGNGNPLQYSCLENLMNRGARWAAVHGVAKSRHDWTTNI